MKNDSQSIKIDNQTKKVSKKRIIHNVEPCRPYPTTRPRRLTHLLLLVNSLDASAPGDGASRQNRRRQAPPRGGPGQDQSRRKTVRRRGGDDAFGGDVGGEEGERGRACHGGDHGAVGVESEVEGWGRMRAGRRGFAILNGPSVESASTQWLGHFKFKISSFFFYKKYRTICNLNYKEI